MDFKTMVVLALSSWWWTADGQNSINYENACCGRSIIESSGLVVIETERVLATGYYTALKAQFCSTYPVWIQLWRQVTGPYIDGIIRMELRWQIAYSPLPPSTTSSVSTIQTVTFASNPATVGQDDRLGLFTPFPSSANYTPSYPIPYDTSDVFTLYFSRSPVDPSTTVSPGFQLAMDDLRWPRSFRNYIVFCNTSATCPPLGSEEGGGSFPPTMSTVRPATPTTATPTCCANCASREQVVELTQKIDNQTFIIQSLQQTINEILRLLQNRETGICPPGFIYGAGVPYCYVVYQLLVQMGVAVLRCSDDHPGSAPLSIRSDAEEVFLRNLIAGYSNTSVGSSTVAYWTTGMFNFNTRTWDWYDESLRSKGPFVYRKWYDNFEPAPTNEDDVCMALVYDRTSGADYWLKKPCFTTAYFICQVPKVCS